jgi:sugar lactone lactonase YvrE
MQTRASALLVLMSAFLFACGGGEGGDSANSRSGVSIGKPLRTTADTVAAAPGQEVTYEVSCSGADPIRYEWDPGDGSSLVRSDRNTFSHTYTREGSYLPRVICTDGRGASAISSAGIYQHISVPVHTVSAVSAVATRGATHTEVTFDGTCLGSRGDSPLHYSWDFGDGNRSTRLTNPQVNHRYPNTPARQYTATLSCTEEQTRPDVNRVQQDASQTVTGSTTVAVDAPGNAPVVVQGLTVNPSVPTTAGPTTLSMSCTASNGSPVSYAFDFGDGSPSQTNTTGVAERTYEQVGNQPAGQYTVQAACWQAGVGVGQIQTLRVNVRTPRLSVLAGQFRGRSVGRPVGVAVGPDDYVYVADSLNHAIHKVSPLGEISTLAGSGVAGFVNGRGLSASFSNPVAVAVDRDGYVYVADAGNHAVRRISPEGEVSTWAGKGAAGFDNGLGNDASFSDPSGVAVDAQGAVYVADTGNHAIRKITADRVVSTFAGSGAAGNTNAVGTAASFSSPRGVAIGNRGDVYVADTGGRVIRVIDGMGSVRTLPVIVSHLVVAFVPHGLSVDSTGSVHVSVGGSNAILSIPANGGEVSSLGFVDGGFVDSSIGYGVRFSNPQGVAIDSKGIIYVADTGNNAIRTIGPTGVNSLVNGRLRDGRGVMARFGGVDAVAVDNSGAMYVVESSNFAIRKVGLDGLVSTFAVDKQGYSEGRGSGLSNPSGFWGLSGVAVDGAGSVYVADGMLFLKKLNQAGVSVAMRADVAESLPYAHHVWLLMGIAMFMR